MNKQALVIGRFQPLCENHVKLFEEAYKHGERLLIGLGRPNETRAREVLDDQEFSLYQLKYPFSVERTSEWIHTALEGKDHKIVTIEDIFDPQQYEQHVIDNFAREGISLEDTILIGENPQTYSCFTELEQEISVGISPYHATDARRELMMTGRSNLIVAELSDKEKQEIIMNERVKDRIETYEGKLIYNGHVRLTHEQHHGRGYDIAVMPDACAVMYIDEEDKVWFTKQYRAAVEREILELPAETIDKAGLSALDHIVEGLEEECGIAVEAKQFSHVSTVGSSEGHDTEYVHLFRAQGPYQVVGQRLEDGERISIERIPFDKAYDMFRQGILQGSKTAILLQDEYIRRIQGGTK